jgi:hypothetical protein
MNAYHAQFRKGGKYWAIAAALSLSLLAMPEARSESATLAGTWVGGGVVAYATGGRERARCQANYSGGSSTISVNATCATPSGSISQFARLRKTGANSYAGTFFNVQYNTSGSIHVVVHGNTQSVSIASGSGSASLSLRR